MGEPGGAEVGRIVGEARIVAASQLMLLETRSSLARREREGSDPPGLLADARARARGFMGEILLVEVGRALIDTAGALAERRPIHSLDAIHLASALEFAGGGDELVFLSYDRRLRDAARAESLAVFPA